MEDHTEKNYYTDVSAHGQHCPDLKRNASHNSLQSLRSSHYIEFLQLSNNSESLEEINRNPESCEQTRCIFESREETNYKSAEDACTNSSSDLVYENNFKLSRPDNDGPYWYERQESPDMANDSSEYQNVTNPDNNDNVIYSNWSH